MPSLDDWARHYGADKGSQAHGYTEWYEKHLASFVGNAITLIEIGIGSEGNSLKMWRSWLGPAARVVGIDKNPEYCTVAAGLGFESHHGDAADPGFIGTLMDALKPDVLIDDGSHYANEQKATFEACFAKLPEGATYVIEDLHAAFWGWGGHFMPYLHGLVDKVNNSGKSGIGRVRNDPEAAAKLDSTEKYLSAMHCYPSIVFFDKRSKT